MTRMKRNITHLAFFLTTCVFLWGGYSQSTQGELNPKAMIQNVFSRQGLLEGSWIIDISATSVQNNEINTAGVRVYFYNKEKQIVVFTAPEKLKDGSYLVIGYNTWMYEKKLKRPLRISAQQKLFGDAGIAETAGIDYVDDYRILKMIEHETTLEIDLKALDLKTAYQQAQIWLQRDDLKLKQIILMALNGKPLKRLQYSNFQMINGHEMAKIEIQNLLYEKDRKTILEFMNIRGGDLPLQAFDPLMMDKYPVLLKF